HAALEKRPAFDTRLCRGQRLEPVAEHKVRVRADEQVREEGKVIDAAAIAFGEPGKDRSPAFTGERHGLRIPAQIHPTTDPYPGGVEVDSASRWAHAAELGVDLRAVVALLVVLVDQLPDRVLHVVHARDLD